MDENLHQENERDLTELSNGYNKSLPPRSTLHDVDETEETGGNKIIHLLLGSFVFIVIIAVILLLVLKNGKTDVEPVSDNQTTVAQEDTQNGDGVQVEVPVEPDDTNDDTNTTGNTNSSDDTSVADSTDATDQNQTDTDSGSENGTDSDEQTDTNVSGQNQTYVIKSGDNLYRISIKFYDTGKYYEALAIYNNLSDVDAIYAGLKIEIPPIEKLQ